VIEGPDGPGRSAGAGLWGCRLRVGVGADRMGYRLEGGARLPAPAPALSSAVPGGTIQLPPDGCPIVLLADRQTTGGYLRLGTVISADLPVIAHLQPGDWVEFTTCDLETARDALEAVERQLAA